MDKPHKKLLAWQKAIELVENIYHLTQSFPQDEKYGLTSQIRRSAVSIPSNIAEGTARSTVKDKFHFLIIARGSLSELDTQLEIAKKLNYTSADDYMFVDNLMDECARLLQGLINKFSENFKA
ncbi:MAG: four helix bundle protein [Bacteroidetes bacterium]|nr:four helix bundle protein [Bacteroidota bacterium]